MEPEKTEPETEPTERELAERRAASLFTPEKARRGYVVRAAMFALRRLARQRERDERAVVYPPSRWRQLRGPSVSKAEAKRLAYPRRDLHRRRAGRA